MNGFDIEIVAKMAENGVSNNGKGITSGLSTAEMLLGVKSALNEEEVTEEAEEGVELDESDVVWSADDQDLEETLRENEVALKPRPRALKTKSSSRNPQRHDGFQQTTFGLSVALAENTQALRRLNLSKIGIAIPAATGKSRQCEEFSGRYHRSAPVNVPLWSKSVKGSVGKGEGLVEDEENEEERLPPHEILARQQSREHFSTFSMCEGRGRTLKGSDVSRVRDAIWRQMGFDG